MEAKLKVILVSHTPNPEQSISAAARLCYSPADVEQIISARNRNDNHIFLEKLIAVGHLSPIEHASFTFAIEGISRACSHQLVRHRLASYSQQSQRYVGEEGGFGYIIPPAIKENNSLRNHFEHLMEESQRMYTLLVQELTEKGRTIESAREDARFVLPNAAETKIMVTMNARELLHFFSMRLCNRAQWEIRDMAFEMLKLVKAVAPTLFHHGGPPCLKGKCPEGPRSCGKPDEIRRRLLGE
ncbi:MAG: Thymidylate synthase ThyX [Syntrophorhabdus sp. PtaU1.Bin153]|nr:MAG: Thymidylate synthase ThyX [Syntrophorhabdus sp. PtaU1.Bin153]